MTIRYEFQGGAFRNASEMLDAIAGEWLSAGGLNSEETQAEFLRSQTDAALASECVEGWGLDQPGQTLDDMEPPAASHMDFNGYTAGDLASAFARLRQSMAR